MSGHIHIHHHEKHPCIQNELNEFLQSKALDNSIVENTISYLNPYLSYFSDILHTLFSQISQTISTQEYHLTIGYLEQSLDEISFQLLEFEKEFETNFVEHVDAKNCLPLSQVVIKEIIQYYISLCTPS
ncbi:MAG: hypothetical protein ACLFPL_05270 [Candidatus Nanoarchaeia archaeon]